MGSKSDLFFFRGGMSALKTPTVAVLYDNFHFTPSSWKLNVLFALVTGNKLWNRFSKVPK